MEFTDIAGIGVAALGVLVAVQLLLDKVSKLTANKTDDKIAAGLGKVVGLLQKVFGKR